MQLCSGVCGRIPARASALVVVEHLGGGSPPYHEVVGAGGLDTARLAASEHLAKKRNELAITMIQHVEIRICVRNHKDSLIIDTFIAYSPG